MPHLPLLELDVICSPHASIAGNYLVRKARKRSLGSFVKGPPVHAPTIGKYRRKLNQAARNPRAAPKMQVEAAINWAGLSTVRLPSPRDVAARMSKAPPGSCGIPAETDAYRSLVKRYLKTLAAEMRAKQLASLEALLGQQGAAEEPLGPGPVFFAPLPGASPGAQKRRGTGDVHVFRSAGHVVDTRVAAKPLTVPSDLGHSRRDRVRRLPRGLQGFHANTSGGVYAPSAACPRSPFRGVATPNNPPQDDLFLPEYPEPMSKMAAAASCGAPGFAAEKPASPRLHTAAAGSNSSAAGCLPMCNAERALTTASRESRKAHRQLVEHLQAGCPKNPTARQLARAAELRHREAVKKQLGLANGGDP
ncbi:hypothetical protein DIPPA_00334 [Diplonema papillatum]|nr:hypothetical protein DIPPA_00334 [Diplonema papillatum]